MVTRGSAHVAMTSSAPQLAGVTFWGLSVSIMVTCLSRLIVFLVLSNLSKLRFSAYVIGSPSCHAVISYRTQSRIWIQESGMVVHTLGDSGRRNRNLRPALSMYQVQGHPWNTIDPHLKQSKTKQMKPSSQSLFYVLTQPLALLNETDSLAF